MADSGGSNKTRCEYVNSLQNVCKERWSDVKTAHRGGQKVREGEGKRDNESRVGVVHFECNER